MDNRKWAISASSLLAAASLTACGGSNHGNGSPTAPAITQSNGVVGKSVPQETGSSNSEMTSQKEKSPSSSTAPSTSRTQQGEIGDKQGSLASATPSSGVDSKGEYRAGVGQKSKSGYGGYSGVNPSANIGAEPIKGGGGKTRGENNISGTPISIEIPSIGLSQRLGTVTAVNNVVAPRSGRVSWYNSDVKPGVNGIAKIMGHVTYNGPDVFYNLHKVPVGGKVIINYSGGGYKSFTVYSKRSVNKEQLRTDPSVWGSSSTPVLALITCDGFSRMVGLHHVNNYILLAR